MIWAIRDRSSRARSKIKIRPTTTSKTLGVSSIRLFIDKASPLSHIYTVGQLSTSSYQLAEYIVADLNRALRLDRACRLDPTPHSSPSPDATFKMNLDEEVRLYTTPAERERAENLATLYSIIVSLEYLERAYVRDSVSGKE